MNVFQEWAIAYARQAQADLQLWSRLELASEASECHRLLFLQMACEKLTKAHLCIHGSDPADLQKSHAYVAKNLPIILRQLLSLGFQVKNPKWVMANAKRLAQEIELLAPAVKRGGQRLDNCEYPWADAAGQVRSPLDWSFSLSRLLLSPAGRVFLKLLRIAIERLV